MHRPTKDFRPRVQRCLPCRFIPPGGVFFLTADSKSLVSGLICAL